MKSLVAFLFVLASAGPAFASGFGVAGPLAQGANASGTLRVTVVDPSSAVIPGATVTVKGIEDATKASWTMSSARVADPHMCAAKRQMSDRWRR